MFFSAGYWLGFAWFILYSLFKDCIFCKRSLGKLICGLKIIDPNTNEKPRFYKLILRNLTTYCLMVVEGILVLANNNVRLGDMIAKTQVVPNK